MIRYIARGFVIVLLLLAQWAGVAAAQTDLPGEMAASAAPVAEQGMEGLSESVYDGPGGLCWLRSDYVFWWTKGIRPPALVTSSPQGTPSGQAGVLPTAEILFGNRTLLNDGRSGGRTTFGLWLDPSRTFHVELDYLLLGQRTNGFSRTSTGSPILARPFYNTQTAQEASVLVAYPSEVDGTISITARDQFQSAGALLGHKLLASYSDTGELGARAGELWPWGSRTDLLAGFRYYNLNDRLAITDVHHLTQAGPTQNTVFRIHDTFHANNDFYGGELGFRTHLDRGRWSLEFLAKFALGTTRRSVAIAGDTQISIPNQPTQTYDAGLFALGTNSGNYRRDTFTVIPHLGMELGCQVTERVRVYAGYDALYWACVSRGGEQMDTNVDPRNFPPPLAGGAHFPAYVERPTYFWAQGISAGAEIRF